MNEGDKNPADTPCEADRLRAEERPEDRRGDRDGDAQRGGRLPAAEGDAESREPRPADDAARSGIPSRSFNL